MAIIKVTQLWIPYIIFKNTDDDEAVKVDSDNSDIMTDISVTREGSFTRSGPEVVDEVISWTIENYEWKKNPVSVHFFNTFIKFNLFQIEIFSGEENILTMNQTHSKKFHCTYLLHYYPFDTQGNYSLQYFPCV